MIAAAVGPGQRSGQMSFGRGAVKRLRLHSVVKIKRSNGSFRYSPALLNPAELLSAEILQRFYPAATRHGPDSRLVGLLQRIRDGLLHGEGTSLGIPAEHCLKLAVYAIGAITYKCGLKPEWQARGGAA